jgi:hypothetical protein
MEEKELKKKLKRKREKRLTVNNREAPQIILVYR